MQGRSEVRRAVNRQIQGITKEEARAMLDTYPHLEGDALYEQVMKDYRQGLENQTLEYLRQEEEFRIRLQQEVIDRENKFQDDAASVIAKVRSTPGLEGLEIILEGSSQDYVLHVACKSLRVQFDVDYVSALDHGLSVLDELAVVETMAAPVFCGAIKSYVLCAVPMAFA